MGGFTGATYVKTQDCEGRAHEPGVKVPPALLSLGVKVPESALGELAVSVTCTENSIVLFAGSDPELGEIAVLVGSSAFIARA